MTHADAHVPLVLMGGSVASASRELARVAASSDGWLRSLDDEPVDGRVLWTFEDDGVVHLYWRSANEPDPDDESKPDAYNRALAKQLVQRGVIQ